MVTAIELSLPLLDFIKGQYLHDQGHVILRVIWEFIEPIDEPKLMQLRQTIPEMIVLYP